MPILTYTPIILQPSTTHPKTKSSISFTPKPINSISKDILFFSDDDNEDKLSPTTSPIIERQPAYTRLVNEPTTSSLQVDSIIPMEYQTSDTPTKYMSFLSEDDDDNKSLPSVSTSIVAQQSINQEYISPLEWNESTPDKDNDDTYKTQSSDKHSSPIPILITDVFQQSLSSTEDSLSNKQIETISENIQDTLLIEKDRTTSTIPVNTLDSNRLKIVLRLLHVLTQVPVPLKTITIGSPSYSEEKDFQRTNYYTNRG